MKHSARLAHLSPWLAVAFFLASLPGCIQIDLLRSRGPLVETVVHVHGPERGAKLLLLEVDGVIGRGESADLLGSDQESSVARIREQLDRARQDGSLRGILLRIDSPGGEATASDVIYAEIERFKRDRGLPVVAHLYGLAASGGYYVAMAADEIVAEPTTVTGSIGVIAVSVNLSGLMERYGVKDQTTKAGAYKDTGSMLRPQTAEDREILQGVIDDLHERFRVVVARGRPKLSRERVDALSDGRIFSAPQALERGLVDRIGDIETAVSALEGRVGVASSYVVSYHRPSEWRRNLYTRSPVDSPRMGTLNGGNRSPALAPGFHYLWWPGGGPLLGPLLEGRALVP
jgi:protease-4